MDVTLLFLSVPISLGASRACAAATHPGIQWVSRTAAVCEDLFSIFNLQRFRDVSFYLGLGYLCRFSLWAFISGNTVSDIFLHLSVFLPQSEEVTL